MIARQQLALAVPGIKILIFSTGMRASTNLMNEIKARLSFVPGASERICRETQEHLYIAAASIANGGAKQAAVGAVDTSTIYSLPAGTSCT